MKLKSPITLLLLLTTVAIALGMDTTCLAQYQTCNSQCIDPAAPFPIWGVDSTAGCGATDCGCGEVDWKARGYINWQAYAQGEYVGHARTPHVLEYRIRVDDQIAFVFRFAARPNVWAT